MALTRRRALLFGGLAAGGALVVGVAGIGGGAAWLATRDRLATQRAGLDDDGRGPLVALWLRMGTDGQVTVLSPHTEMGQGAQTGLLQCVAEELDLAWEQAHIETAPATAAFSNGAVIEGFLMGDGTPTGFVGDMVRNGFWTLGDLMNAQITGGSASIRFTGWKTMRHAAAAARAVLVAAAAARLGVAEGELTTELGEVVHAASGQRIPYGELVTDAASLPLPEAPALKPRSSWRYIGKKVPRLDLPDKIFARATYGIDQHLDGLLHAAVALVPVVGAEVTRITNEDEVKKRRGVHSVHVVPGGVAVVADNPWRAEQAVRSVTFEHSSVPHAQASTASLFAEMRAKLDGAELSSVHTVGDVDGHLEGEHVVEAEYEVPFLAHAPMEPLNATVTTVDGKLHIYVGVQNPLGARAAVAAFAELEPDDVVIHPLTMGGGFGRRASAIAGDQDHIDAAVQLHRAVGKPVKLLWSREADIRGCFFRNGSVARIKARAHPDGTIAAWDQASYGSVGGPDELVPHYTLSHARVRVVDERQWVPYNYWRSVDASIYPFFTESMVDELAAAAGVDPLEARLKMLADDPRTARVVRTAADMAGWRTGVDADGKALGLAVVHSFGSIVAHVAEVSLVDDRPRVHRVFVAADVGTAVNPDAVEAQMQGAVQWGLTAMLYGRIDFADGGVVQSNFHDYQMVRMAEAPEVIVRLLDSPEATVGGAGEPGVPPLAPAVANALAVLGKRPRKLPILA